MADPRFFAKLDVGYFDNPKVVDFIEDQPRVLILHLRAIVYCRQHLTNGRFPIRSVVRLACASHCGSHCESQCDFCAAVDAGLIVRIDERTAEVHDYLKHQDSAERVAARKAAGQAGAASRWGGSGDANRNAKRNANRNAKRNAVPNAEERRGEESSSDGKRRAPEAPIPEDWTPTDGHRQYATEHGIDLSSEAFKFRNHAIANDRRQRDWDASFRMWLAKAKDFAPARRPDTDPWAHVPVIRGGRVVDQ